MTALAIALAYIATLAFYAYRLHLNTTEAKWEEMLDAIDTATKSAEAARDLLQFQGKEIGALLERMGKVEMALNVRGVMRA